MAIFPDSGTIAVTNGNATVTGTGTAFVLEGVRAGDFIFIEDGGGHEVYGINVDPTAELSLTLKGNYLGTTGAGKTYFIVRMHNDARMAETYALLRQYLDSINSGAFIPWSASGTLADRATYDDADTGFVFAQTNISPWKFFTKDTNANADWSASTTMQGPQGPPGEAGNAATVDVGTTTTGAPGSNADATNSGTTSAAIINFTIPEGQQGDAGTLAVGTVATGAAGSNVIITNSGTPSAAILNITIPQGDDGNEGWSAVLALETNGLARVFKVVDWVGGQGTKPTINQYIGSTSFVTLIADAVDVRGIPGTTGAGTGDMLVATYDATANGKVDVAELAESVDWANIQSKPDTFPTAIDPVAAALIFGG